MTVRATTKAAHEQRVDDAKAAAEVRRDERLAESLGRAAEEAEQTRNELRSTATAFGVVSRQFHAVGKAIHVATIFIPGSIEQARLDVKADFDRLESLYLRLHETGTRFMIVSPTETMSAQVRDILELSDLVASALRPFMRENRALDHRLPASLERLGICGDSFVMSMNEYERGLLGKCQHESIQDATTGEST